MYTTTPENFRQNCAGTWEETDRQTTGILPPRPGLGYIYNILYILQVIIIYNYNIYIYMPHAIRHMPNALSTLVKESVLLELLVHTELGVWNRETE